MYVNTPERRSHICLNKNHKFGSFFAICVIFFFMVENFRFFPNASFNTFDLIWHRSIWKYTNSYRFLAPRDCRNASTSSILFRWNLANGTRRFCFPREVPKKKNIQNDSFSISLEEILFEIVMPAFYLFSFLNRFRSQFATSPK